MVRYGNLHPILALGVLALFALLFGIFFGAFGLAVGWVARASAGVALAASPFLWVAAELARTYLFTGVPWNLLGYAVQATGVRQVASVTGVYGLSFLAVASSALMAWVFAVRARKPASLALAFWMLLLVIAQFALRPPGPLPGSQRAFLLQPNVPLEESSLEAWEPWRDPAALQRLVNMSLAYALQDRRAALPGRSDEQGGEAPAGGPPLIIWAENPAPFFFPRDAVFHSAVQNMARQAGAYVIVNTVNFVGPTNDKATNSAVVLDPNGQVRMTYDKIHLVPFGEYVPDWAFPGKIGKITSEVGSYVPGASYNVAKTPQGTIGVFICYESIFPQLVRRLTGAGAEVLVNISNDAWYGDSAAAAQHLEMARLRAIENRRYLLRATNDGITAVIDPYGRVVASLPRHRLMVLSGWFSYLSARTFYTAHGDVFAWLCVAVAILIGVWCITVRRTQEAPDDEKDKR